MKWKKEELELMEEFVKEHGVMVESDIEEYKVMEIFPGRNWDSIRTKSYVVNGKISGMRPRRNLRKKINKMSDEKYDNIPDTILTKDQPQNKDVSFDILRIINNNEQSVTLQNTEAKCTTPPRP